MEDIFEHLEMVFVERRSEAFNKSKEYNKYMENEWELLTKFKGSLDNKQQKFLEQYLAANTATQVCVESLSYKQGMIDLLDFLKSIGCEAKDQG